MQKDKLLQFEMFINIGSILCLVKKKVIFYGIKHRNIGSISNLLYAINSSNVKRDVFLLEYDKNRYLNDQVSWKWKREKQEFFIIISLLSKKKLDYRYIDKYALKYREIIIRETSLFRFVLMLIKKKIGASDFPLFNRLFFAEREKHMIKAINKYISNSSYNNIHVVI